MTRSPRTLPTIVLLALLAGCGGKPPVVTGVPEETKALLVSEGQSLDKFVLIVARGSGADAHYRGPAVAAGGVLNKRHAVEVHNLPADWRRIGLLDGDKDVAGLDRAKDFPVREDSATEGFKNENRTEKSPAKEAPPTKPPTELTTTSPIKLLITDSNNPGRWVLVVLIAVFGFYSVAFIGVSGGPNHGEHPFMVNIGCAIMMFTVGASWVAWASWTNLGCVIAAIVLSFFAINYRIWSDAVIVWIMRGIMSALYAALIVVLCLDPPNRSAAQWLSHGGLFVTIERGHRSAVDLEDAQGQALFTAAPGAHETVPLLIIWTADAAPAKVRIRAPGGAMEVIELGDRPKK